MKTHMMNRTFIFCLLFSFGPFVLGVSSFVLAKESKINPISKAYLKELSFLKAQKKALQQRVEGYQKSSLKRLNQAQAELGNFEKELLSFQRRALQLEDELQQRGSQIGSAG